MEKDILGDILKDVASGFDMDIDAKEDPKQNVSETKADDIKEEQPAKSMKQTPQPAPVKEEPQFVSKRKPIPKTEEPMLEGVNLENLSQVAAQTVKAGKSWVEELLDFTFNTVMNTLLMLINAVLALVGGPQLSYYGNGETQKNPEPEQVSDNGPSEEMRQALGLTPSPKQAITHKVVHKSSPVAVKNLAKALLEGREPAPQLMNRIKVEDAMFISQASVGELKIITQSSADEVKSHFENKNKIDGVRSTDQYMRSKIDSKRVQKLEEQGYDMEDLKAYRP